MDLYLISAFYRYTHKYANKRLSIAKYEYMKGEIYNKIET